MFSVHVLFAKGCFVSTVDVQTIALRVTEWFASNAQTAKRHGWRIVTCAVVGTVDRINVERLSDVSAATVGYAKTVLRIGIAVVVASYVANNVLSTAQSVISTIAKIVRALSCVTTASCCIAKLVVRLLLELEYLFMRDAAIVSGPDAAIA